MKDDNKKKIIHTLKYKILMFILFIGYFIYFIYEYITKDYDIFKKDNIITLILIFTSIILLGLASITNNKISLFFTINNYIIILILIIPTIITHIPKKESSIKVSESLDDEKITCTGSTELSDDTQIDIDYKDDEINKMVYTYIFDLSQKDGAENLVNRFDRTYQDIDNIYSEITISDKVTVKLTYNIEHIDKDKLNTIDEDLITSYKQLKEKELQGLSCQKKEAK